MNQLQKKLIMSYNNRRMTIVEKVQILSKFPLLEDFTASELQAFAERMFPKVFMPKEVFEEEDIDAHHAFFMYSGVVSIFRTTSDGEIINIDLLGAPELVGEMGLIDNKPSPASAMAVDETHALVLSQQDFQELIHMFPRLAIKMLKLFADRMRDFDMYLEELLSKNLYDRTWQTLQHLGRYYPNKEITLSQEELADLLWGTRARVTEVLNKLQDDGKILINHRKVTLL